MTAEIEIWDLGADALYSRMTKNYLYGTNVIFLCYDTTNYATFQNLEEWLRVLETASAFRLPKLVLIGNKRTSQTVMSCQGDGEEEEREEGVGGGGSTTD